MQVAVAWANNRRLVMHARTKAVQSSGSNERLPISTERGKAGLIVIAANRKPVQTAARRLSTESHAKLLCATEKEASFLFSLGKVTTRRDGKRT